MLNIYNYYTEPSALPLYKEASESFKWMKMLVDWVYDDEDAQGYTKEDVQAKIQPHMHIIAKSPESAYLYAEYFLGHRFPEGEKAISSSPVYALDYSLGILRNDPNWQYKSGRWPAAEPTIKTLSTNAVIYARRVLAKEPTWPHDNGRWPEAEPYIMEDAEDSWLYAEHVLQHRWKEAEPVIKKDSEYWENYKSAFNIQE